MELLLSARVTILTSVSLLANARLEPVVALFDLRTRRRAVLVHGWVSTAVARVVILRTRESLAAQSRRAATRLRFVVVEYVLRLAPFRVLVEYALLF